MMAPMDQHTNEQTVFTDKIMVFLAPYGIKPSLRDVESFSKQLIECWANEASYRKLLRARWYGAASQTMDILHFLKDAWDSGRADEAFWCAFLAAHFGRASANLSRPNEVKSAGRFLCAFGDKPTWTWTYVSANRNAFADQLVAHKKDLETLRFGNHRKYCSKKPQELARVVTDFVQWVDDYGGSPSAAFALPQGRTAQQSFGELFRRFTVYSFGRTGRFDLLNLLSQTGLLNIQADSCYLPGSSGPLDGAKLLCGTHDIKKLSEIIDSLARSLSIPYDVMEDALCIWQKKPGKQTAGHPPSVSNPHFIPLQTIHRK